jgi:hypothetical protein
VALSGSTKGIYRRRALCAMSPRIFQDLAHFGGRGEQKSSKSVYQGEPKSEFEIVAPSVLAVARVRTVGADIKGPNQPSVLFEGQLHGAGYALGWLPAQGSRASLSRRVCCESHPATGRQAIGSLELTCHVALVSEAGLGSSSGK